MLISTNLVIYKRYNLPFIKKIIYRMITKLNKINEFKYSSLNKFMITIIKNKTK